ncbi:MAG: nickel pincer cofactor biosynthesis protein LarC [Spirochaetaceae bacterium]|jgi:uncharacterized protein (TIGR00299 family) protein|nr:nickel pincer cofactor biosynthesis protein LarC [Spirochaetaceae bacterium]
MTLHFDCFAGISGDMALGAFVDLGVAPELLIAELKKLNLDSWSVNFSKDQRCGISGTKAVVSDTSVDSSHCGHTHYGEIRALLERSGISAGAKKIALDIFGRIAKAEAEVHAVPVDDVAFHEVGAIDSIIDISGAAICLDILKPDKITAGEIELGGGFVKCAHGILPVPAPATLKLVAGLPVKTGGFDKEMTTPTGAAILASCVDEFVTGAAFREIRSGYGIGHRITDKPNVLRVSLREESGTQNVQDVQNIQNAQNVQDTKSWIFEKLFLIETNIDDMTGEDLGFLMERLFNAGALDVTFTPCVMKKSRPGTTVSILAAQKNRAELHVTLFEYSSAIGFKETEVNRISLKRSESEVQGNFGSAKIKTVKHNGGKERSKIEYEDKARIAREKGITLNDAEILIKEESCTKI